METATSVMTLEGLLEEVPVSFEALLLRVPRALADALSAGTTSTLGRGHMRVELGTHV